MDALLQHGSISALLIAALFWLVIYLGLPIAAIVIAFRYLRRKSSPGRS
jgi:hypothetical protein